MRRLKYHNSLNFDITCKEIALFLTSMLKEQAGWLLQNPNEQVAVAIKSSFKHLVQLLQIPEEQIFKIIIEFFHYFTKTMIPQIVSYIQQSSNNGCSSSIPEMYLEYLKEVRSVLCLRMSKPQEVLIVIDETGTPVKEDLGNT